MTRQEGKSAMEEMLASIREAIHEEAAHQAVGLHAPLRVRAAHETPAMQPDNDQTREGGTPGFLKPLSEDATETEWVDSPAGYDEERPVTAPEQDARAHADNAVDRENVREDDIGGAPFAPRRKLLEKELPSVGGIMSGRTVSPATNQDLRTAAPTPPATGSNSDGDAMVDASLPDAAWWPDEPEQHAQHADEPREAAPQAVDDDNPDEEPEPIVSPHTGELAARAFDMLRRELTLPEDMRAMTEEMLRPMLREWLDANLPDMVERLVREEIARIAHGAPARRTR